jgi:hypothetical protein
MKILFIFCSASIALYFGFSCNQNPLSYQFTKVNVYPVSYPQQATSNEHINVSPQHVSIPNTSKIWVENAIIRGNDTIKLHFSTPNAPFLGVIDPDGHFFYVVFPSENSLGALLPVVESRDFVNKKIMLIAPKTFKADPYRYGVYTNLPVFTKSGKYTFIMGENLHVDDPDLLDKVEMQYVMEAKPNGAVAQM